jgi:tRNA dimethylallyltransferase
VNDKPLIEQTTPVELAPLVAIVGPTASGKSGLAVFLAERLGGEVVNYDSVQMYRGFSIGTGKLTVEEQRGIPHHLLGVVDADQVFTAGDFRREAARVLEEIRGRHRPAVLVGGTGLYLRALLIGLAEAPPRSPALRERLREKQAWHRALGNREFLHRLLKRLDPGRAARIHPRDNQKLIRAIEVSLTARQPMSKLLETGRSGLHGFKVIKIGLNPDRALLFNRINRRVEHMFRAGLVEETREALARSSSLKPLEALGYKQAAGVIRGELNETEAIIAAQAATRHYAKRQMTWFRQESDVQWLAGVGEDPAVQRQAVRYVEQQFAQAHRLTGSAVWQPAP